jgi:hypothetical protein
MPLIKPTTRRQPPPPPLTLLDFQEAPASKLVECLEHFYTTGKNTGALLVMPTRCGKTYTIASALRTIQDKYPLRRYNQSLPSERFMVITPASVTTQFKRVLIKTGVNNFNVTSPTSMSAGFGDTNLSWISIIKNGILDLEPVWDDVMKPDVILLDECQWVKNHSANITKVIISAIKQGVLVIFISATPFTTLRESFCVCMGLKLCRDSEHHKDFCSQFIFNNQDYAEPNNAAMARFNEYLLSKGLKIEATGIKFKHRVFNKCILIDFQTRQQAEIYKRAYDTYVEECAKANKNTPEGRIAVWIAMLKFQQCAEALKSSPLVLRGLEMVGKGKQVLIGSNFVFSLDIMISLLVEKHNIPRNRIGICVGIGRQDDRKYTDNITYEQRQKDIDRFQRGEIDFFFLTLKSGGAGLSLHHEYSTGRPRHVLLPPTYSAIEQIQVLGRAHGPTSLSTTYQEIVWFTGKKWGIDCIEEYVASKVNKRMRSIKEIVSKRETWTDLLLPDGTLNKEEKETLHTLTVKETDEIDDETGTSLVDGLALDAFENEMEVELEQV